MQKPRHIEHNPSTSKIRNSKPLAIFYGFTARFVSDLVENPEDSFSRDTVHMYF